MSDQQHKDAGKLGSLAQQSESTLSVSLRSVVHARDAEHPFDGRDQSLNTAVHAGRANERQRPHIFVIFKDCADKALPRAKVTHQRINVCVCLCRSVPDDCSEVFAAVAPARRHR